MPHQNYYYYILLFNIIFFIVTAIFGLTMFLLAWVAYHGYFVRTKTGTIIRSRLRVFVKAFIENQYTRYNALFTFLLCGIIGAAVDIDHIPEVLISLIGGSIEGRLLHSTFLIIACLGCAYYGNLLYREFKRNKDGLQS